MRPRTTETTCRQRSGPVASAAEPSAGAVVEQGTTAHCLAKPETSSSRFVELLGLEPIRPGALVVLLREVARAVAGEERRTDAVRVLLVAWAPGRRRDVHDV